MSASARLRDLFHAVGLTVLAATALTLGRDILVPVATAVLVWFLINAMAAAMRTALPLAPAGACTLVAVAALTLAVLAVAQVVGERVGALSGGLRRRPGRRGGAFERHRGAAGPAGQA
jgi:predicted PurR-regulated permease PerM